MKTLRIIFIIIIIIITINSNSSSGINGYIDLFSPHILYILGDTLLHTYTILTIANINEFELIFVVIDVSFLCTTAVDTYVSHRLMPLDCHTSVCHYLNARRSAKIQIDAKYVAKRLTHTKTIFIVFNCLPFTIIRFLMHIKL